MFEFLSDGTILELTASIVALASVVANITDSEKDNKAVSFIGKIVNIFALNWRTDAQRKNKQDNKDGMLQK